MARNGAIDMRPEGGDVYTDYTTLVQSYRLDHIHPIDLKASVSRAIVSMFSSLDGQPEAKTLFDEMWKFDFNPPMPGVPMP